MTLPPDTPTIHAVTAYPFRAPPQWCFFLQNFVLSCQQNKNKKDWRTRKIGKKGKSELVGIFEVNLRMHQRLYLNIFSYYRNLENLLFLMVLVRFFYRKNSQSYRQIKSVTNWGFFFAEFLLKRNIVRARTKCPPILRQFYVCSNNKE